MSIKVKKALELFLNSYNCAQSVLGAFCEDDGLDLETALKLACGFGGGGMRYSQTCGAVSGAMIVIGLKCGHYEKGNLESKKYCYKKTHEFIDKFKEKNKSAKCRELLGLEKDEKVETKDSQTMKTVFTTVCSEYVKSVVQILENMEF
jgi:C_GCAxxG_C_C family probable redox protein